MNEKARNTSGLKPLGRAVLIRPYEPEINSTLLIIPPTVKERTAMVETRAVVMEVGSQAWADESEPRARPGDKVFVAKYAGFMAIGPADGQVYRFVNANDVFAGITDESFAKAEAA